MSPHACHCAYCAASRWGRVLLAATRRSTL